jgi:hypothetical protein
VHAYIRGRFKPLHRARSASAGPGRRRRAAPLGALVVLMLAAAACSGSSEAASSEPDPTFSRGQGATLEFPEPVATVAQLLPPTDDQPWSVFGSVFDPESDTSKATTWTSDDGRSWERQEQAPDDSDVTESFSAAADSDSGRYAVGWVGDGEAGDAAVWRQEDDGRWDRIDAPEMGGEHEQWASDVVSNGSGILVAGGESVWGEVRARLWFSPDGESWQAVDGGPGGPFDTSGRESLRDIAPLGEGFVAVGSRNADNDQDGVAWYSPDGQDWTQAEAPTLGGDGRQSLQSVTVAGDVVVAGGYNSDLSGQGKPVVWRSRDGQQWGPASDTLPLPDSTRTAAADLTIRSLTVGDGGIVAAGGSDWRPALWRSPDNGRTWTLLPNPVDRGLFQDGVALAGAATKGDTTLALGLEPTMMRLDGDRWQDATGDQFPKGGEQPFGTSIAIREGTTIVAGGRARAPSGDDRERLVGQVWTEHSDDWAAVDTDHLNAGQIMDVTAYSRGFIAVGSEDFGLAERRTAGDNSSPDGLIWVSEDGRDWSRVGADIPSINPDLIPLMAQNSDDANLPGVIAQTAADQPFETADPAGGPGTQSLEAVAPLADGFIAVGVAYSQTEADPIVATSGNGERMRTEETNFGGPGTQRFRDVCVSPDGVAVAVGVNGSSGAYDIGVRRRRANSGNWSESTVEDGSFAGPGSQQAYACAASDQGFVLVGSDDSSGDADARIWTSEDGVAWTRVESGLLGGAGDQWASAVSAVPDDQNGGWLIGGTDTVNGDGDVALWRLHPDGELSRRDRGEPELSGPGEQSVSDIAIDGDRVLVVGDDYGRVGIWESDTVDR